MHRRHAVNCDEIGSGRPACARLDPRGNALWIRDRHVGVETADRAGTPGLVGAEAFPCVHDDRVDQPCALGTAGLTLDGAVRAGFRAHRRDPRKLHVMSCMTPVVSQL